MISETENTENQGQDAEHLASRRDFLNWMALLGLSLPSSSLLAEEGEATFAENLIFPFETSTNLVIFRPQDLLYLQMQFVNFKRGRNQLERDGVGQAYLVVHFQPQSIAEQAFDLMNDPRQYPAAASLADASRLVFRIGDEVKTIPFTAEKLLDWTGYELVINPRAIASPKPPPTFNVQPAAGRAVQNVDASKLQVGAKASRALTRYQQIPRNTSPKIRTQRLNESYRLGGLEASEALLNTQLPAFKTSLDPRGVAMKEPDQLETAIEMPWRLLLSPNQYATFAHDHALRLFTDFAKLNQGKNASLEVYELWHTRLALKTAQGPDESELARKALFLRAIWGFGINTDPQQVPEADLKFKTSLSNADRHQIVHKSSNWQLPGYVPKEIDVKRLMLSTLGAWLDTSFTPPVPPLSLSKWAHLATMGRDHYVEVVNVGYVMPFGHKAAYVKITERKTEEGFAVNRTREFVIITEEVKKYQANTFRAFPFRQIRINTLVSPNLDQPVKAFENSVKPGDKTNFAIAVAGKGFPFKMSGVDPEGREIAFELPLVFVSTLLTGNDKKAELEILTKQYNSYQIAKSQGVNPDTRAETKSQKMAIAESLVPGDTSFEVDMIQFGVQPLPGEAGGFYPNIVEIDLHEPAYEAMTGKRETVSVELVDDTKSSNKGLVFAKVTGSVNLDFTGNADKAGGALTPNYRLTGLSKLQGAVGGTLDEAQNLNFNPESYFTPNGGVEAKLFGVVSLSKLMNNITGINPEPYLSEIKALVAKVEDARAKLEQAKELGPGDALTQAKKQLELESAALKDKMGKYAAKMPVFKNTELPDRIDTQMLWNGETKPEYKVADGLLTFKSNNPASTIQISTLISRPRNGSAPSFGTTSSINDFNILLAGIIQVNFQRVAFKVDSQAKTDISVDMKKETMSFLGPLSFLNDLKNLIPADGFSDPPFLDVTPSGVVTGYTLSVPDVSLGAFMLRNISLGAAVNLPFTGAPMSLRFNFCERHQPFTLTVSALGGGGFFGLELDLKGLRSIEAALEFGAAVGLNLGVASGAVSVMAGIYFKMTVVNGQNMTELTGYVRINGALCVLGLITVSVMFYLGLTYNVSTGKAWGEAILMVKVEVLFFSKTVSLTTRREFAGSGADPTFGMMIDEVDWKNYCDAFAA